VRIAYHYPAASTIYAQRTIHHGFKRAFEDLGHSFHTFSPGMPLAEFLDANQPDIFISASHFFYRKQLDYELLARWRERGMKLMIKIDFWTSPLRGRINEAKSLKDDHEAIRLIRSGRLGDVFFHVVEQDDPRMDGFTDHMGVPFATVPLAADRTLLPVDASEDFAADVAYVGTWLPDKRQFLKEALDPLRREFDVRVYGQDWTRRERAVGLVQRAGQYFDIAMLRSLQKPRLDFEDELTIYRSARVSVNVHESYQRRAGGDCNERTFKIPLAGGFEVTDEVSCLRRYFEPDVELVIAASPAEWREKVVHFLRHPEERAPIIEAGRQRVLRDHTYHNRAAQLLDLAAAVRP
jgi:spore maturation protein CgeB